MKGSIQETPVVKGWAMWDELIQVERWSIIAIIVKAIVISELYLRRYLTGRQGGVFWYNLCRFQENCSKDIWIGDWIVKILGIIGQIHANGISSWRYVDQHEWVWIKGLFLCCFKSIKLRSNDCWQLAGFSGMRLDCGYIIFRANQWILEHHHNYHLASKWGW